MFKNYLQLIRFDKPIGTFLLLWPTLWALLLSTNNHPQIKYVIVFTVGVFLTRAAGCAFNDIADIKFDRFVTRTQNRPLASGSIGKKDAYVIAISLSLIAFIIAITLLNTKTILLCIPAFIIYVTYPLFKRFFPIPQAYLGIAFSFGILMVFIEIQNSINCIGWLLFIANILWVIGYDTIYALVDIQDDRKIGIRTSPLTFGRFIDFAVMICYILFIGLMIIIGILARQSSIYFSCLFLATLLLIIQILVLFQKKESYYLNMFLLNNYVGMLIFIGFLINYL